MRRKHWHGQEGNSSVPLEFRGSFCAAEGDILCVHGNTSSGAAAKA